MSSLEDDADFLLICCGTAGLSVVTRWRCSQWACGLLQFLLPATKTYAASHKHVPLKDRWTDLHVSTFVAPNSLTQDKQTRIVKSHFVVCISKQKWFLKNLIRRQVFCFCPSIGFLILRCFWIFNDILKFC